MLDHKKDVYSELGGNCAPEKVLSHQYDGMRRRGHFQTPKLCHKEGCAVIDRAQLQTR
jgi:hypothetical protein